MADTIDDWLFGLIAAPAGLRGVPLMLAIVLAQWALLLGPAALTVLWIRGTAEDRQAAVSAALAALLGLAAAAILSSVYFEPRPFMEGVAPNILGHATDSGYPSDHATLLFALCFGFWSRPPPTWRSLWIPALGLALAVSWARVFLGVHYPVDILGAAFVAAVAAAATATTTGRLVTDRLTVFGEAASQRLLSIVGLRASR